MFFFFSKFSVFRGREASAFLRILGENLGAAGAKGREASRLRGKFKRRRRKGTRSVPFGGKFGRRRREGTGSVPFKGKFERRRCKGTGSVPLRGNLSAEGAKGRVPFQGKI